MLKRYIIVSGALALLWAESLAGAVELAGTVQTVMGEKISIKIDPELLPNPGDKVEVFNTIPGLGAVALDCQWQVQDVRDDLVVAVTKDKSRATAQQGYKAVIYCPNPRSTKPPAEPEQEKPAEKQEPVKEEPPSQTKKPQKQEEPPKIEEPPKVDAADDALVLPGKGPQPQPPKSAAPRSVTPASLQGEEPWVMDWMAHDILIDFPGGGRSGLYLDPVRSGEAHPSPGRRGILYVHPVSAKEAAKIGHSVILQGPSPMLKLGVCGNRDPNGDCLLVVTIDGARWGTARPIEGADGWQDLTYDLSPFTGRMVMVQIEIHSNNGQREYAFFDYIRIKDEAAPSETPPVPEQPSEPEPKPVEQVMSVSKVIFADQFDGENEDVGQLNYARLENWFVRSGEADLLGRGLGNAYRDHGLYIELHGSGYMAGKLQSKRAFRLSPGTYLLEFDLAANPKGAKTTLAVALGKLYSESFVLEAKKPFETVRRRVEVSQTTNASLVFRLSSRGVAGPLLDNVRIAAVTYGGAPTKASPTQKETAPLKPASPYLGVRVATHEGGTVRLVDVTADSPAGRAGLLAGDIVLKVNDVSLGDAFVGAAGFTRVVTGLPINRPVMFIIRRGTKRLALWVKLEPRISSQNQRPRFFRRSKEMAATIPATRRAARVKSTLAATERIISRFSNSPPGSRFATPAWAWPALRQPSDSAPVRKPAKQASVRPQCAPQRCTRSSGSRPAAA